MKIGGDILNSIKKWGKKMPVKVNSPVILGFVFICFIALMLDRLTNGLANEYVFSVYHSPLTDPLTYIRMFGHVFGHAGWDHFIGNMMLILIVGPLLEEKYGSKNILIVMAVTAFVTGIVHYLLFYHTQLLGASGVVFALILLSSFTRFKSGGLPLTFLLVAVIYLGQQLYEAFFVYSNISNLTHIIGGIIGAVLGYILNTKKKYKFKKI